MSDFSGYTLYWNALTGAFAPEALLVLTDAPYQTVRIDHEAGENFADDYLAINPMGQIPTLKLPDGSILTESVAMLLHIADSFPHANLLPPLGSGDRAQCYRWLMFLSNNVYTADLRYYYASRYTTDSEGAEAVQQAAVNDLQKQWAILETALSPDPYVFGETLGAIDIYLAMMVGWDELGLTQPKMQQLMERVRSHPKIAPLWGNYFPI